MKIMDIVQRFGFSVSVFLSVLGLSLSVVSGQLDGDRLAPLRHDRGIDWTNFRILSFDNFGIGEEAFKCFIEPGGNNWYDPNGVPLWVGDEDPANRVGDNPGNNEILLRGLEEDIESGRANGILLNRGASYYELDGQWCCGSNGGRNLNTNRCVTFTPCPALPFHANGALTYNRDTNVVTYSCNNGVKLVGNGGIATRICSGTTTSPGTWSGSLASCGRLAFYQDTSAADFSNRILSFDDFGIGAGSPPALQCFIEAGGHNWYDPNGNPLWVGDIDPADIAANRVGNSPHAREILLIGLSYFGDTHGILLNRGAHYYELDGLWCCGPNGGRDINNNFCITFTPCPTLPVLANGDITYNRDTNVATYSCDGGYRLEGNDGSTTRACSGTTTSPGTWSGSDPACVRKLPCLNLVNPLNGIVSYDNELLENGRAYGTVASYQCNLGFTRKGVESITCEGDNNWTDSPPTCEGTDCGQPNSPANGSVALATGSTTFASMALYSCDTCYQLSGSAKAVCEGDGHWKPETPVCVVKNCSTPPPPVNGAVTLTHDSSCGSEARYGCEPGYCIKGSDVRTCEPNENWSLTAPVCAPVDCGEPGVSRNGRVVTSRGTHFPSVASYSCGPGFNLTGCSHSQCQADGTWSCDPPFCADNQFVQLKFGPTSHCVDWSAERVEMMYTLMRNSILKAIHKAGFDIPDVNIASGYFSCFYSTTQTSYRTRITGTEAVSAVKYATMIQSWVESGVSSRLQWYIIKINKNCPVRIESMEEDECEL